MPQCSIMILLKLFDKPSVPDFEQHAWNLPNKKCEMGNGSHMIRKCTDVGMFILWNLLLDFWIWGWGILSYYPPYYMSQADHLHGSAFLQVSRPGKFVSIFPLKITLSCSLLASWNEFIRYQYYVYNNCFEIHLFSRKMSFSWDNLTIIIYCFQ